MRDNAVLQESTNVSQLRPKKKKGFKPRVEVIKPHNVVDVWRLFKSSIDKEKWVYPKLDEESPDEVRHHVMNYVVTNPQFFGLMLKVGRRCIGQIIGDVKFRAVGHPHKYFFIWNFWIEPEYRHQSHMKLLWASFRDMLKKAGIHYWEADVFNQTLIDFLLKYRGYKSEKRYVRMGGKT